MAKYTMLADDDPDDAVDASLASGCDGLRSPANPRDMLRSFNPSLIGFGIVGIGSSRDNEYPLILASIRQRIKLARDAAEEK